MELRHIRYFLAVAQELHFGRAAERLHMAQPPLSHQIQQLEREMAVQLFARTKRRVELTDAGRLFQHDAQLLLENLDSAVSRARRAAQGETGYLGVGFVGSATYDLLPAALRAFREQFPDVQLDLLELTGSEQERALRENRIQVGFSRVPYVAQGVRHETLMREPLMVALPSRHPLAGGKSLRLTEVRNETFILFRRGALSGYGDFILDICRSAGFTPREGQQVGEMQTAISLIAAGLGVTLVPHSIQNVPREGVVFLPLRSAGRNVPAPTIGLTVSYLEDGRSTVVNQFLDIVRRQVPALT